MENERRTVPVFTARQGWGEEPDPFDWTLLGSDTNPVKDLGYSAFGYFGNHDTNDVCGLTLWRRVVGSKANWEFVVDLTIGYQVDTIVVPSLPDLLALLRELEPLMRLYRRRRAEFLDERRIKREGERDRKRKAAEPATGPVRTTPRPSMPPPPSQR